MKNLFFLLSALILLGLAACDKKDEHDHAHVNINILSPAANEVVSRPDSVVVRIDLSTEGELHDVDIELKQAGRDVPPFPQEIHEHSSSYNFSQVVNLSNYPSGSIFELHVHACEDHDCTELAEQEITFTIP